ncbi:MAG: hypothetical protein DWQ34_27180 [Planctomycetota bacterium]|nr:MAG: hypothetical protein DWQ34_27180 [Planctomycetota bacterium]
MNAPDDPSERPSSRFEPSDKTCLIVGIVAGGLGSAFLLCGGGCLFLVFYYRSMTLETDSDELERQLIAEPQPAESDEPTPQTTTETAADDGFAEFARKVRIDLEDHPVIREHVGEIEQITYDETGSLAEPDDIVFVFQLTGSKSSGTLRAACITVSNDEEDVTSGELTLENGETFQLFPDNPLDDTAEPNSASPAPHP